MNLTVILLNTNFQGNTTLKKLFINLSRFACFYLLVLVHMQINGVDSGYPRGLHCITHSLLFYKGFKRSY